jgi:hypothetical protein
MRSVARYIIRAEINEANEVNLLTSRLNENKIFKDAKGKLLPCQITFNSTCLLFLRMTDPSQTSPQARALVNNRNNLADMYLRKTLAQVEREKTASITELDHERLEVLDFLRNLKICDSDKDPTYLK